MGILDGKGAVVTGGARGIGRGHCLHLANNGASVVINDIDADEAQRETAERTLDLFEVDWQNPAVSDMFAGLALQPDGDEFDRRMVGEMMRRSGDGPAVAGFLREQSRESAGEQAKRIAVPTLVIRGRSDASVPMAAARDLVALIPGSQLEIVEGGHWVSSSGGSPAVRRRILDFFEME